MLRIIKTTSVTFFEDNASNGKCLLTDIEADAAINLALDNHGKYYMHSCLYQAIWFCFRYVYGHRIGMYTILSSLIAQNSELGNNGIHNLYFDTDNEDSCEKLRQLAICAGFRIEIYSIVNAKLYLGRKIGNETAPLVVKILSHDNHFALIQSEYDNFDMINFTNDGHELDTLNIGSEDTNNDKELAERLQKQEEDDLAATLALIAQLENES